MAQTRLNEDVRQGDHASVPDVAAAIAWGAFILCILLAALSIYRHQPPDSVPASAIPTDFSSGRALRHVEAISRNSHPIGSREHAGVGKYILDEVASMGVAPAEFQETTVATDNWGIPYRAAKVRNVLARLKGTGQGKAVLLASHYDSVATGPGAGDDAVAVAALLETLRALKAGAPLKNDVIFLFTDAEEIGLLGAKAFVDEHAWAKDVGVALNFDARGTSGPSYMFETSDQNGRLIQEFAQAAPHPVASSLAYEIYRLLPNDTDMTVFNRAGFDGLNFAYIGGSTKYHTMQDSLANVDERSLQHHGSYALALTRRFGNLDLPAPKQANAVYFNAFGALFFHYSAGWILPLAGIVLVLFIAVIFYGYKKRRVTISGLALGVLSFALSVFAVFGVVKLAWWLIYRFGGDEWLLPGGNAYHASLYLLSFVALSVAVTAAIYLWFSRRADAVNLTLGALVWWVVLMVAAVFYLPGGSYLLMWPLLFGLAGVAIALAFPQLGRVKILAVATLCAIPGLFLLAPTIYSLGVALALSSPAEMQIPVVLLLGLLIPQLYALVKSSGWLLPLIMATVGIGLIIYAHQTFKFDQDRPRQSNIFYALNADSGKATWASTDRQAHQWTSAFFPKESERGSIEEYLPTKYDGFLKHAAPAIASSGPEAALLDDQTTADGVRVTRLRITSPRQAPIISIYADVTTPDLKATIDGKSIGDANKPTPVDANHRWGVIYWAVPPGGIELVLRMKTAEPLKISVTDRSYGLPQIPQMSMTYPGDVVPLPSALSDSTFVTRKFTF
ncbi:MAG TPA: M20/M25/M40 family metallo-hydrolase [Pyrinomonadaceae bacterium]|nr:M20/M25/M40 family metallo-hydrolase [Pyrinomonadaceae bacterium]